MSQDDKTSEDFLRDLGNRPQDTWSGTDISRLFLIAIGCNNLRPAPSAERLSDEQIERVWPTPVAAASSEWAQEPFIVPMEEYLHAPAEALKQAKTRGVHVVDPDGSVSIVMHPRTIADFGVPHLASFTEW